MSKRIYLSSPHMSDEGYEMGFIQEAFDTNWIAPLGKNVDEFEKELAQYVGMSYAAALVSGTAAIHLALKSAGVCRGDIVLCQSLTFSASANPIIYEGGIPVFVDSSIGTWSMCPDALEEALKKYPEAKAVIVVHIYGLSADMDRIVELCDEYGVVLIEDAAESLGTTYKGKMTGSFGDYGILSFNGNKIITTSGGGMLLSNDKGKIDKARFWSTQSRESAPYYQHEELGYNYRMSNIVASIGRGQMKVLEERIAKKQYIYNYYKEKFALIDRIELMPINEWNNPNCWLTAVTFNKTINPLDVLIALEEQNIESRPLWKPMHLQPYFKDCDYIGGNISEDLFNRGLCLPSDTKMTDRDLRRVVDIIMGLF